MCASDRQANPDGRRLDSNDDSNNTCAHVESPALIVLFAFGIVYMFLALAIVCDEFFVPALEVSRSKRKLPPKPGAGLCVGRGVGAWMDGWMDGWDGMDGERCSRASPW